MKNAGIIAEYNPFHSGHLWQIEQARRMGAETVTVALAGDFSQRGRPAAFSKFARAEAALRCGADLVAELPLPFCCASAEGFAAGGVAVLRALGCVDTLCFGAETAEADRLDDLAGLLLSERFRAALKEELTRPVSFPAARAAAAERLLPGAAGLLAGPNNILGVEYLKAIRASGGALFFTALPRQGVAHDAPLPKDRFASASALRVLLAAGRTDRLADYIPPAALHVFEAEIARGAVAQEDAFSRSLLSVLRSAQSGAFAHLPSGGEGLENLLAGAAQQAGSVEELYTLLKSKRYTHARVRRLALEAYLSIHTPLPAAPAFLRVLGASEKGLGLLKQAKIQAARPVVFSLAQAERLGGEAAVQAALTARAGALYGLCCQKVQPAAAEYSRKFIRV